MSQRYKHDMVGYDYESRRDDYRRRSRSRSRSRHRRYRRDDSRSRSRGRSPVEYRRRYGTARRSCSRSRSRSYSRRGDRYASSSYRRHRDSHSSSRSFGRSRSRSRSRSRYSSRTYRSSKRATRSRSTEKVPRAVAQNDDRHSNVNEAKQTQTVTKQPQTITKQPQTNQNAADAIAKQESNKIKEEESTDIKDLPLPKRESIDGYYKLNTDEPFDRERIHREIEEKLRQALAKEGKTYPRKKPEPSHPVFANDGSFLELFKKMQQQQTTTTSASATVTAGAPTAMAAASSSALPSTSNAAAYIAAASTGGTAPPPAIPIVGRRRGGKILKTGVVAKPKVQAEQSDDPKDFWSLYLAEVNKYKSHACEAETGNRPLVK